MRKVIQEVGLECQINICQTETRKWGGISQITCKKTWNNLVCSGNLRCKGGKWGQIFSLCTRSYARSFVITTILWGWYDHYPHVISEETNIQKQVHQYLAEAYTDSVLCRFFQSSNNLCIILQPRTIRTIQICILEPVLISRAKMQICGRMDIYRKYF